MEFPCVEEVVCAVGEDELLAAPCTEFTGCWNKTSINKCLHDVSTNLLF